jgi:uncharacterized membrane protein YfcA
LLPLTINDYIGNITLLLISAVANAGGIGGGGLVVPILMVVLNFYTHEAIPLSKLMIFAGALTSYFLGFKVKHPFRNAISIDYNIPILLCPLLLFGTMIGVSLNKVLPPIFVITSLTLVLFYNTYKTFIKGKALYLKELNIEEPNHSEEINSGNKSPPIQTNEKSEDFYSVKSNSSLSTTKSNVSQYIECAQKSESENSSTISKTDFSINKINDSSNNNLKIQENKVEDNNNKNKIIIENESEASTANTQEVSKANISETYKNKESLLKIEEKKDLEKFPLEKLFYMLVAYLVMISISLVKGSDHFPSLVGVESCSSIYWIVYFLYIPFAILFTLIMTKKIKYEYELRRSIGYKFNKCDIKWNNYIFIKFPIVGCISGCLSGMLGIGGGLVLGPVLLELGLHPVVSSATSNFLVLFTSSSTAIQFLLLGMMRMDYGIVFVIVSSVGSFLGTIIIQKILAQTGRYSYLIFTLTFTLFISAILIPGESIFTFIRTFDSKKQSIFTFHSPC